MQRSQTTTVRFAATHALALKRGVILPRGHYTGTETRIGVETISGNVSWTVPRYKIALTKEQLPKMGPRLVKRLLSEEIDVTTFVRSGELTVT